MKKFVKTYKLAIFIGALFSLNALASSIVASFLNVNWGPLSGTEKFLIVVLVIQNWSGTMIAYFNKTLSRIESGLPLIEPEPPKPEPPKP